MGVALFSKHFIRAALLALFYFLTVVLSQSFLVTEQRVSLFWPASGVLFAFLLISSRNTLRFLLPLTLIAHCAANILNRGEAHVSVLFALVNVAEAYLLVVLYKAINPGSASTRSVREILTFVALVFGVSSPLSAFFGALTVSYFYPGASFGSVWWTWWLAVLTGCIIAGIATTCAVRSFARIRRSNRWQLAEALLCFTAVGVLSKIVFEYHIETFTIDPPFLFLCFPLLIWAALRFGTCGAANASLIVSMVASYAATRVANSGNSSLVVHSLPWFSLQLFLVTCGLTVMLLGSLHEARRRHERQLLEASRQLNEVTRKAGMLAWEADPESSRTTYVGENATAIFGYQREDWYQPTFWDDRIHPDDRARAVTEADSLSMQRDGFEREYRFQHADGSWRWVRDITTVVRSNRKPVMLRGFLIDITERKEEQAAREALTEQLHHAQRLDALGQLAGGVAHDFNNMLAIILGQVTLISKSCSERDSVVNSGLGQISQVCERAKDLVRQLLTFGRKDRPSVDVINAVDLVERVAATLDRILGDNIMLSLESSDKELLVVINEAQLEQIVVNLAVNARDAMPDGGELCIRTSLQQLNQSDSVSSQTPEKGDYFCLTVSDSGSGMSDEVKARVFEPFFTTKPLGKGTGLGLSTVYGIVRERAGYISIDSSLGYGTTVKVYLPISYSEIVREKLANNSTVASTEQTFG